MSLLCCCRFSVVLRLRARCLGLCRALPLPSNDRDPPISHCGRVSMQRRAAARCGAGRRGREEHRGVRRGRGQADAARRPPHQQWWVIRCADRIACFSSCFLLRRRRSECRRDIMLRVRAATVCWLTLICSGPLSWFPGLTCCFLVGCCSGHHGAELAAYGHQRRDQRGLHHQPGEQRVLSACLLHWLHCSQFPAAGTAVAALVGVVEVTSRVPCSSSALHTDGPDPDHAAAVPAASGSQLCARQQGQGGRRCGQGLQHFVAAG